MADGFFFTAKRSRIRWKWATSDARPSTYYSTVVHQKKIRFDSIRIPTVVRFVLHRRTRWFSVDCPILFSGESNCKQSLVMDTSTRVPRHPGWKKRQRREDKCLVLLTCPVTMSCLLVNVRWHVAVLLVEPRSPDKMRWECEISLVVPERYSPLCREEFEMDCEYLVEKSVGEQHSSVNAAYLRRETDHIGSDDWMGFENQYLLLNWHRFLCA